MADKSKPAFAHGNREQGGAVGMTLREYAAIQILPALLVNTARTPNMALYDAWKSVSSDAVKIADTLIAELDK